MLLIRRAEAGDAQTILGFVRGLAQHVGQPGAVQLDLETLRAQLQAERPPFECLLAEVEQRPVGFALFFYTYSTWRGQRGVWLEDLFVSPEARGQGVGKRLLVEVARTTRREGCARLEWSVINTNESAFSFYEAMGAKRLQDWTICRVTDDKLTALASAT